MPMSADAAPDLECGSGYRDRQRLRKTAAMNTTAAHEVETEWVHIAYKETSAFTETYGFAGNQGMVNVEGLLFRPKGVPSKTLLVFMHPASTLQLLPVPRAAVQHGAHVLCAADRKSVV